MNTQKLSVNRACVAIVSFLILLSVVQFCIVYLLTDNRMRGKRNGAVNYTENLHHSIWQR